MGEESVLEKLTGLKDQLTQAAWSAFEGAKEQFLEVGYLWLEELAGDAFPTIVGTVGAVVDQVELYVEIGTSGIEKEQLVVDAVLPVVMAIIQPKLGFFGSVFKRWAVEPQVEKAIRFIARDLVAARNKAFSKKWKYVIGDRLRPLLHQVEDAVNMDIDRDGHTGEPPPGPGPVPLASVIGDFLPPQK